MHTLNILAVGLVALAFGLTPDLAPAQQKGNIVCWKDKAGKTVGCGDKVPLEYQDNASRELNKRGMTINQTEAALTPEQRQAQAVETERKRVEAQKREEERRRDRALLDSFTNEKEIDLKRHRDIQQIEINISAQQSNLKNTTDRQHELKVRMDQMNREKRAIPAPIQEDYDNLETERLKVQAQILQKRKEIVERNIDYDAMKARFMELKGMAPVPPSASAANPAAPPVANSAPRK